MLQITAVQDGYYWSEQVAGFVPVDATEQARRASRPT
jgi:hypothetical protein